MNREPRFDLHATRYGEVISEDLKDTDYTESQCGACPHGHRCCDLVVMATPAEGAGILTWLSKNSKDIPGVVRAIQFRATVIIEHFKGFGAKNRNAALNAWFAKKVRCIFYDREEKRCGIYPVRPTACRRAWGNGDCEKDGIKSYPPSSDVLTALVSRYKLHPDINQNTFELVSMLNIMLDPRQQAQVDQAFFNADPETLTPDQVIFGLNGASIPNPINMEKTDGSA